MYTQCNVFIEVFEFLNFGESLRKQWRNIRNKPGDEKMMDNGEGEEESKRWRGGVGPTGGWDADS